MRAPAKKSKRPKRPNRAKSRPRKKAGRAEGKADAKAPPAPAPVLTSAQRSRLRALAHALEPIVQVGHAGVTRGVVTAVSQALLDHELIKVRLHEPQDKRAMSSTLAAQTLSALCGLIGHTVILYRPHPKRPKLKHA